MICKSCRLAGDGNTAIVAGAVEGAFKDVVFWAVQDNHDQCPGMTLGKTWCDCQHFTGKALRSLGDGYR